SAHSRSYRFGYTKFPAPRRVAPPPAAIGVPHSSCPLRLDTIHACKTPPQNLRSTSPYVGSQRSLDAISPRHAAYHRSPHRLRLPNPVHPYPDSLPPATAAAFLSFPYS